MIDFTNGSFVKLKEWNVREAQRDLAFVLLPDEEIFRAFKGMRDSVTFTNKRVIALNVKGMTGKKKDYTSLPLSKIQAFSVETAGTIDLDSELELWFSGLGSVKLDFDRSIDIGTIAKFIGSYVL
jgi:Bacterial PH domain